MEGKIHLAFFLTCLSDTENVPRGVQFQGWLGGSKVPKISPLNRVLAGGNPPFWVSIFGGGVHLETVHPYDSSRKLLPFDCSTAVIAIGPAYECAESEL